MSKTGIPSAALSAPVRAMVLASPRLTELAGGAAEVERMLAGIEDEWLWVDGRLVHLDAHACEQPRATVVFQPGSGAYARFYFLLGGLLAAHGYQMIGIDRPGHGLSEGERGDCTVEEAIAVAGAVIDHVRSRTAQPVILMGSSLGGLLTIFGLLSGLKPDLAVAHNFVYPGRLVSFRLRARWIRRFRTRPYALDELVHGFERMSDDPSVQAYARDRTDPNLAWTLTARSVASLFGFSAPRSTTAPETLVVSGAADPTIPAWASRLFTRFAGLPAAEVAIIPGAGHLLFHDHLDVAVPLVTRWLDARLADRAAGAGVPA